QPPNYTLSLHDALPIFRAEVAKDGIAVLVICPGLTQTNFSQNMLEQKARLKMDHMRGMTPERVAVATLRAIERGRNQITLTLQGDRKSTRLNSSHEWIS